MKYPKIQTLWDRDDNFKVVPTMYRRPEFANIKSWLFTEKVDGRNHRVILHPDGTVEHRGRTNREQFADFELEAAYRIFNEDLIREVITPDDGGTYPPTIFYGELYGPKIQSGGKYRDDIGFLLFDVFLAGWWMEWGQIRDFADKLRLQTVPIVGRWFIDWLPTCKDEIMDLFGERRCSAIGWIHTGEKIKPEGIVARTNPILFNRRGERVMWKLKLRDFE